LVVVGEKEAGLLPSYQLRRLNAIGKYLGCSCSVDVNKKTLPTPATNPVTRPHPHDIKSCIVVPLNLVGM
jgi:hypothetical protein